MSSDAPVPLPRTAVPLGIDDPVEKARAELKAALAAIEVKANIPRRLSVRIDESIDKAQKFSKRNPVLAAVAAFAAAAAIGAGVWAFVRSYSR
jgi:hypothetical protein